MIEREKVIQDLEKAIKQMRSNRICIEDVIELEEVAVDALALLREREPRVMTWGKVLEFIELPNEGFSEKTPCYVEVYEPDPDKIKWVDAETLHGWMRNCEMRERRRLLYNRIGCHGWRLWTSRPTPEQMRETKWEGDGDENP